jgi:hypothetical protein
LLKAITKNPPMVALAPELQTEPEELIEHNNHDENDVNIYLHEASIKMLTPRPRPRVTIDKITDCCTYFYEIFLFKTEDRLPWWWSKCKL